MSAWLKPNMLLLWLNFMLLLPLMMIKIFTENLLVRKYLIKKNHTNYINYELYKLMKGYSVYCNNFAWKKGGRLHQQFTTPR